MIKIGMEFRDKNLKDLDFSEIYRGNPGCGGTQFEFALLAHHLLKLGNYEIYLFNFSFNKFEEGINVITVSNMNDIPQKAKEYNIDILIYWSAAHNNEWYSNIDKYCVKSIAWAHNPLYYEDYCNLEKSSYTRKIVAVSREQYELMSGEDVFEKCSFVDNMLDFEYKHNDRINALNNNIVCYCGSLVKEKGFHILAKEWKRILKKVPNAKLYILGSGQLWDQNSKLGKLGIAEESYENLIVNYLIDDKKDLLDSVKFLGKMGLEKIELYRNIKVGVVNPKGTETFCISAIEMEAEGVPVCSKKKNGVLDSIRDGYSGLLSTNSRKLRKNIISLLKNDEYNKKLSFNAPNHAKKFSGNILVKKWVDIINQVYYNKEYQFDKMQGNLISRFKWLRILIHKFRKLRIFRFIPTPSKIEYIILKFKKKIISVIRK